MTDIERLIDQFLAYIDVERGLAKATVRAYDSDLRKYNGLRRKAFKILMQ